MSTLKQRKKEIIEVFSEFDNWEDKYQKLIELAKDLPDLPDEYKIDDNKVSGCVSQVWLFGELDGDKVKFFVDSDAIIVKGLVALLWNLYSGLTPREILADDGQILKEIGLEENLTPNRVNGVYAVLKGMKTYVLGFQKLLEMR